MGWATRRWRTWTIVAGAWLCGCAAPSATSRVSTPLPDSCEAPAPKPAQEPPRTYPIDTWTVPRPAGPYCVGWECEAIDRVLFADHRSESIQCVQLDENELSRARKMTLSNATSFPATYGELLVSSWFDRAYSPPIHFDPLESLKFTEMTREQFAAVEEQRASLVTDQAGLVQDPSAGSVRLEAISDDGSVRGAEQRIGRIEDGAGAILEGKVLIRPDTRIVRLTSGPRVIEELRRPTRVPVVEALVLDRNPVQIAVRVSGLASQMHVYLREVPPFEPEWMVYDHATIRLNEPGSDPCWLLLPRTRTAQQDQGWSLALTLNDAFHVWHFVYSRHPQN